jgi:uncharacterized protein Smg (DUF494 family)
VVIEQVMRLDDLEIDLTKLRLIITLVLFNQTGVTSVIEQYVDALQAKLHTIH